MKNNKFLFSIIVPVYNTEKYILKCLKSIEKAIDKDCEVIIVNDGSTDNSKQVIKEYLKKLPDKYKENFRYIEKRENKGLADTKNVGIESANGKFISVVDSDDYIRDDFYEIARRYVNKYDIIIYDLYVIYEKDKKLNNIARAKNEKLECELQSFLGGSMSGSSCNKIIKKELYNDYKFPVGKEYEDTAVTPFLLCNTENIMYVPYPMYYYLQREKSIVASNTLVTAFYKICDNVSNVIKNNNNDFEKYKYVVNEFLVDRLLEILLQDMKENKKHFLSNVKLFCENNEDAINYIIDSNMVYNIENHYTDNQKKIVNKILILLINRNFKDVKRILNTRNLINYFRNVIGCFTKFLKSIINKNKDN